MSSHLSRELRMRRSSSISAADRLDREMYLVLEDFSNGAARKTDEVRANYRTLISDLLTGQYDHPLRVVAFKAGRVMPPRTWRMNWNRGSLKGTR